MATALVVVNMQEGYMNGRTQHLPQKIVDFMNSVEFDAVCGTLYTNVPWGAEYTLNGRRDCLTSSNDVKIIKEIADKVDEFYVSEAVSFLSEELRLALENIEADTIYIVGADIHKEILAGAIKAHEAEIDCYIVEDLCASRDDFVLHKEAVHILQTILPEGRIVKSSEVINNVGTKH